MSGELTLDQLLELGFTRGRDERLFKKNMVDQTVNIGPKLTRAMMRSLAKGEG